MRPTENDALQKHGKPPAYCQLVKYLLNKYATDDVITEAEDEATNFQHRAHMSGVRYAKELCKVVLRCSRINEK